MTGTRTNSRIGLIGFGAIGQAVAHSLRERPSPVHVTLLRRSSKSTPPSMEVVDRIEDLIATHPDLGVEAAGQEAVNTLVPQILKAGLTVIAVSAGSLVAETSDGTRAAQLLALAGQHGARLIVPSGAIGGLDYVRAVAQQPNLKITYVSRKPPNAWQDELARLKITPSDLTQPFQLFEGTVEEAARRYPQNLNVAATIALTCGTTAPVSVSVVVDPAAAGNTHEIDVTSDAGHARFVFTNAPSPHNPKTSMVTALSVLAAIDEALAALTPAAKP
jgi:aspartate dehydrogenase